MVGCGKRGCPHENFTSDPRPKHCSSCGRHLSMVPGPGLVCVQGTRGCFNDKLAEEQRRRNPSMTPSKSKSETIVVQRGLGAFAPELEELQKGKIDATKAIAVRIPLDLIDEPEAAASIPIDKPKVEQLAASIEHDGLLNPIDVKTKGQRYELFAGRHRLRAHKALGLKEIPAFIRDDLDAVGTAALFTAENLVRRKLPPYEEARNYHALKERAGLTEAQIAARLGVSEDLVKARLQLLELPSEVGHRIGQDHITLQHAEALLELKPYPKLFAIAVEALDKKGYDKQPLNVNDYVHHVVGTLRQKRLLVDPGSYPYYEASGEKVFKDALAKLPRIKVHGEDRFVDEKGVLEKAYQAALAEQRRRQEAEVARMRGKVKAGKASKEDLERLNREQAHKFDQTVGRVTQLRARDVLAKAAHTLTGQEDPRLATLFLQLVGAQCPYDQDFADRVHAHVGAPLELILDGASHLRHGDPEDRSKVLLKLYEKEPKTALQAGVAIALRHLHESGDAYFEHEDRLLKQWAGVKEADIEKKVRAQLKEQAKAGKQRAPWQETPRAVACPTCGAAAKQDCRGPTAHVIKEPHAARVEAFQAKGAGASAPAKGKGKKAKAEKPRKQKGPQPGPPADEADLDDGGAGGDE